MVARLVLVLVIAVSLFAEVGNAASSRANLLLEDAHVSPVKPVAGRPFRVEAIVRGGPRRRRSVSVAVTCLGGLARSLSAHRGKFEGGIASCRWRFARSARGRRFRGTIFVTRGRRSAQAFVTARLR
jgi:hypothetical protein